MIKKTSHGIVNHPTSTRRTDYLYRISIKCLIKDRDGKVLVVKEDGRGSWDLPGGGMDHGESLTEAIAREMKEEVNLGGVFEYQILSVEEPAYLDTYDFWQVRLIFELTPVDMRFSPGEDGDKVSFIDPEFFSASTSEVERRIYKYARLSA